jgi:hypothetical protein
MIEENPNRRINMDIPVPHYRGSFKGHHVTRLAFYEDVLVSFPCPKVPGGWMRTWKTRPVYHEFTWDGKVWHFSGGGKVRNERPQKREARKPRVQKLVEEVQETPVPKRVKRVLRKRGSKEFKEMK